MKIKGKEVSAIIFDLDGTLIDSTSIWKSIDVEFFKMHKMKVPLDYEKKIAFVGLTEAAIITKKEYGFKESIEEIVKTWQDMSYKKYANDIRLKPHVKEMLIKIKENGIKIALATANSKDLYEPCLKRLEIYDLFDYIADVSIVGVGKNDVKLYDHVREKIKANKYKTAVFEDKATCLKTAHINGYISVAVADKRARKDMFKKYIYSDMYITNFKQLEKTLNK